MTTDDLPSLTFAVSGRVARPCAEVYEAVADPEQLSRYFTTAGARGRLEPDAEVSWEFTDFPGRFPITVVEADPPRHLVIRWAGQATTDGDGTTTVTFEFEPVDGDNRTLITISESSWRPTPQGATAAFGNCEGWTGMLAALKAWLEHGVNLRQGFYQ